MRPCLFVSLLALAACSSQTIVDRPDATLDWPTRRVTYTPKRRSHARCADRAFATLPSRVALRVQAANLRPRALLTRLGLASLRPVTVLSAARIPSTAGGGLGKRVYRHRRGVL